MYKLHTDHTQTRTSQLHQDSRKSNKRVSFSTRVIPTTSVNRPPLKSNPQGDRVMHNNSRGKKQAVEDHRRSVKLSKNKMSVTACNDSLNAKTLNAKSVCATCDTCVLNDKHDMCVLKSVAKPPKETVASESNKKPKNFTRKLYEHVRIHIHQSPRGIFINQAKYAQEILKKHGMTSCDGIGTPMATKHLDADLSGTPVDQTKYRSKVGALMYLTTSRPDIMHATCYCARYQA
nr:hypothetical protein [Tanacetum cinerariifolium]